jgi:ubiquinone/menaquinone biosynthesis C-methylase UbiE
MNNTITLNKVAWDKEVENGRSSTLPVSPEQINVARKGAPQICLTTQKIVPQEWLGNLFGKDVLALASGGGQQGPLLSAAGANVTVFDLSPKQLEQDRFVMDREHLNMRLVEGSMTDMSMFGNETFDMIINPVSNCYIPDVNYVWGECYRILRKGGALLVGFDNPVGQILDWDLQKQGICQMKYRLPYSDLEQLEKEKYEELVSNGFSIQHGHLLGDQIGGQLRAGFYLTGLYEDYWGNNERAIDKHMPVFIATRAVKPYS